MASVQMEMNKAHAIDNNTLLGEVCRHLSQGKRVKLRAKGNSMRPFINGNEDILLLAPASDLHKGKIVLAHIDGKRYVIHRIIRIKGDNFTLMGDGNLYEKEICSRTDIYGTVVTVIRNGKESHIGLSGGCMYARLWRLLLPIRRLKIKILNKIEWK